MAYKKSCFSNPKDSSLEVWETCPSLTCLQKNRLIKHKQKAIFTYCVYWHCLCIYVQTCRDKLSKLTGESYSLMLTLSKSAGSIVHIANLLYSQSSSASTLQQYGNR